MFRSARFRLHNLRDKGSNAHNMPFDTMSSVYRDAVNPSESVLPRAAPAPRSISRESAKMSITGCTLPRRSGLQREILTLYKELLKTASSKGDLPTQVSLRNAIRSGFRAEQSLPRRHVTKIEWLLQRGRVKLEELRAMKSNTQFSVFK